MAKQIRFTEHGITSLAKRFIEKKTVENAVNTPDNISESYENRKVYSKKYFDAELSKEMLLRIIIDEYSTELVVITVYKTSQFDRYSK